MPKRKKFEGYYELEKMGFQMPIPVGIKFRKGSAIINGLNEHGTHAFIPIKEAKKLMTITDPAQRLHLARGTDFFIKKNSKRAQSIQTLLTRNGVKVEQPIQSLGKERVLFRANGKAIANSTEQHEWVFQNFEKYVHQLTEQIGTMHSLGIKHNHLHLGNITVDKKGNFGIIDLGKATITKPNFASEKWVMNRYGAEVELVAESIANIWKNEKFGWLLWEKLSKPEKMQTQKVVEKIITKILAKYPLKGIRLTAKDVLDRKVYPTNLRFK